MYIGYWTLNKYYYYLATRGNNKILCIPSPHISSSEEILPRITHRTLDQLRTNKSPFLKSYLHKVDVNPHPSPRTSSLNTHPHIISSTASTDTPRCQPWICGHTAEVTPPLARCCCMPSETYERNGVTQIFRSFYRTAGSIIGGWESPFFVWVHFH